MSSNFDIDADLVRKLAGLLKDTGLSEIEFSAGEKSIRVSRGGGTVVAAAPVAIASSAPAAAATAATEAPANDLADAITSPMVGTAYLSPTPGAAPFIKVGDTVKAGDTLLIIEAMKVMNPIKAAKGGVVQKILVADTKPVEFGEPLVLVA